MNTDNTINAPEQTPATAPSLAPLAERMPSIDPMPGSAPEPISNQREPEPPHELQLHIGELSIQGFPGIDRDMVGAAIQRELSRLLADPETMALVVKLGNRLEFDGGNFRMPRSTHPEDIGVEIARALVRGLRNKSV